MGLLQSLTAGAVRLAPPPPDAPPPSNGAGIGDTVKKLTAKSLERRAPHLTAEIRRICAMPIVHRLTQEEADAISAREVLADAYRDGFRLKAIQADAILSLDHYPGPCCAIRVGGGKTLIALMAAERCHRAGAKKTAIFVPPSAYAQLTDSKRGDIKWARGKVPLNSILDFHYMRGKLTKRMGLATAGLAGCYIIPYSILSEPGASEMLNAISPDAIIADEAHRLSNRKSARTKRVTEYLKGAKKLGRKIRLVLMSGTLTGKSIRDYWHLISECLEENSPLPLSSQTCDDWSVVLDAKANPSKGAKSELMPLIEWGRARYPNHLGKTNGEGFEDDVRSFREAYSYRLRSTPGVVTTEEDALGTTLILHNEPVVVPAAYPGYKKMLDLMAQADAGETPNGDEIAHAMQAYKWKYELTAGFYNELYWNEKHDPSILERSKEYEKRKSEYTSALRTWFDENFIENLDAPWLVAGELKKHGARRVGEKLYAFWQAMEEADFLGRVERSSRAERVCDYKVRRALQWAKSLEGGGLLWYFHNEIGDWLVEAMKAEGLDPFHACAGENEWALNPAMSKRLIVLSVSAHSEAKNLQSFHEQMFVQWPRSAKMAEQALGRTHRPPAEGQTPPDELIVVRNDSTEFDFQNFGACLNDAVYIHETMGSAQKLVYANYDPLPTVYESSWLRQNGFRSKQLTAAQRKILAERFGAAGLKTED